MDSTPFGKFAVLDSRGGGDDLAESDATIIGRYPAMEEDLEVIFLE